MKKWCGLLLLAVLVTTLALAGVKAIKYVNAESGKSVSVTDIDYDKMTLTISGNGDKVYYISDGKQAKWDKVVGTTTDGKTVMDISWISATKAYVLSIMGDVSTTPVKVTLPKYNHSFKVTYNKAKGTVTYKNVPSDFKGNIQWRVKGFDTWNETPANPSEDEAKALADKLSYYINEMAGTTVYFRTSPIKGTSVSDTGVRPSKVVTVAIPKKSTAPSVSIDGNALTVKVPKGVQYRVVGSGNDWSVAKAEAQTIELNDADKKMANKAFYSTGNPNPVDQIIEFRSEANSTRQISASKFIRINAQEKPEEAGLSSADVKKTFLSSSLVRIDFDVAEKMKDNKYEYVITKPEESSQKAADGSVVVVNPDKDSKWISLPVKSEKDKNDGKIKYSVTKTFSSDILKKGYTLFIRKKTSGTAGADNYKIASAPCSWTVESYPGASTAGDSAHNIKAVKGSVYSSDVTLSYAADSSIASTNTSPSAIKIVTESNSSITLAADKYSVSEPVESGDKRIYTINIKKDGITSLLANSGLLTDKVYTFYIELASGETIKTNTTLEALTATSIVGEKSFTKYKGIAKTLSLTFNLGTKLAKDYDIKLFCNGNSITSTNYTFVDASGNTCSTDTATYVKCEFSVHDEWLDLSGLKNITANVYKKNSDSIMETISGVTVGLKMPITISQMGSTTFTEGQRSSDVSISLTIGDDSEIKNGFSIDDILWKKDSSTEVSLIRGTEVNQSGLNVNIKISAKTLNTLPEGSSKLFIKMSSGSDSQHMNSMECEVGYVIKVTPDTTTSSGASSNAASSSKKAAFKTARAVRLNKGADASSAAGSSEKVEFAGINYDEYKISIRLNGNNMAFFSANKKTWYPVEGTKSVSDDIVKMNINWISNARDYTMYLRGDKTTSEDDYVKVVIPKAKPKFKAAFDKASTAESPKFTLSNRNEDVKFIQWRKYADYHWNTIAVNNAVTNGDEYIVPELENLRVKGGKIVLRTKSIAGTSSDDMGIRTSNEVTLSITKRAEAPAVKINAPKSTLNTSTAMEYYDVTSSKWKDCTKTMNVWDIPYVKSNVKASDASAGKTVTVDFRKKATTKSGYSKTITVKFKGQSVKPSFGSESSNDVTYGTVKKTRNKKEVVYHTLVFNKASSSNKYQYTIVLPGTTYDEAKAKWLNVSKSSVITLSQSKSVKGTKIYVRTIGVNANTKLKTDAKLPSAVNSYTIP